MEPERRNNLTVVGASLNRIVLLSAQVLAELEHHDDQIIPSAMIEIAAELLNRARLDIRRSRKAQGD